MSVEISAENRQEYQAWTPVEEDLEGLPKNIHDLILQMRVDCSTTDRNRMPYYGADDDIDKIHQHPVHRRWDPSPPTRHLHST